MTTNETDFSPIIDVLEDVFGDYKNHNDYRGQISFDCPVCSYEIKGLDEGDGKGNLEINYKMFVYKCWSCAETHDTHGHLSKLVRKYGSPRQIKQFFLFLPDEFIQEKQHYKKVKLPYSFTPFSEVTEGQKLTHYYKQAIRYINSRNITPEMLEKYKIGYCTEGLYENRIVIPSYDGNDNLNYFVARSYLSYSKLKYRNPQADKEKLIWNEHLIDWEKPIYLVEGVFDSLFVENSIPLLGKFLNNNLFEKLYDNAKKIIIVLDGDAWDDAERLYHRINGGKLMGKIWIIKLPIDSDIADLRGDLSKYQEIQLD